MADNNPNALMKAKQEGEASYQELITKDEAAASRLQQIAQQLVQGHRLQTHMQLP